MPIGAAPRCSITGRPIQPGLAPPKNQTHFRNTNHGSAAAQASRGCRRPQPCGESSTTATMGVLFAGGAGPAVRCRAAPPPARPGAKVILTSFCGSRPSARPTPRVRASLNRSIVLQRAALCARIDARSPAGMPLHPRLAHAKIRDRLVPSSPPHFAEMNTDKNREK
jgi:hypothetical protein